MSDAEIKPAPTSHVSPVTGFGAASSLFLCVLLFIVPQLYVGLGIALLGAFGVHPNENSVGVYFAIDAAVEILTFGLLWQLLRVRKHRPAELLGRLKKAWQLWFVPLAFGAYFMLLTLTYSVVDRLFHSVDLTQDQANPFKQASSRPELVLAFIGLVILTPIIEELVFRGFLYRGLKSRLPKYLAAIITSLVFARAHGQLNVGIDTFILSLFLIALLEKTNSLIPSIMLHAMKNLLAFVVIFSGKF